MTIPFLGRALTKEEVEAKESAIRQCKLSLRMTTIYTSTGDVYAYPSKDKFIAWGVNGSEGFCIARGEVRR